MTRTHRHTDFASSCLSHSILIVRAYQPFQGTRGTAEGRTPHQLSSSLTKVHSLMSHAIPSTSSAPNFQLIFNNALEAYKKRTKNDLLVHPLVVQLQNCNSPNAILAVIHQQVKAFHQSQGAGERLTKWFDPTVKVLYSLSKTLGEVVSLVCLGQ